MKSRRSLASQCGGSPGERYAQPGKSLCRPRPAGAGAQRIAGRLQATETHAYLLNDLRAGDQLTVSMRATSGNLDPAIGIVDATLSLEEVGTRHQADLQRALAGNESVALALNELRNRYFLAFDDDSGAGYTAALQYVVPAAGDYVLIASSSLSTLGRVTPSGNYELLIGLNAVGRGGWRGRAGRRAHRGTDSFSLGRLGVRGRSIRNSDCRCAHGEPEAR